MTRHVIPPHAVILAAGLGSRLRPLTDHRPKPLVEVHGVPILHNTLAALAAAGITRATVVVGYCKEAIQRSCGTEFAGVRITYVASSEFERTGSAYSLWLAREALLQGDTLLLEGDVFFEPELIGRVLVRDGDVAAVAPFDPTMSGSGVVLSPLDMVAEFRMNQTAADLVRGPLFKTINVFRFQAPTLRDAIVPELDRAIRAGESKAYVEQILARLVAQRRLRLAGVVCDDMRWFEIDSEADLRIAERIFAAGEGRIAMTVQ